MTLGGIKASDFLNNLSRFWAQVEISAADECWLWLGETNNHGYGRFSFWQHGQRERVLAHRLSLLLAGRPLPDSAVVMHTCDTPSCLNPQHLEVGSQVSNMRDAQQKGRTNLEGLTAVIPLFCRECSKQFLGQPNRRYCDDHRPRNMRRQNKGAAA